ncbi:hypothetical protein F8388_019171 [Cannabis sativa]|uniref:Bet v I/Major latex protein domain-containing protein n=1 Tax=Cannabis sativa TaxID=3483 RepID=A0A7J6EBR6_CANSA|nr:hypothetical protein F8388_019171 [Cannabis sativa]KAF4402612.1 hypothetical protein G4B88_012397 [Cannabis sativa]
MSSSSDLIGKLETNIEIKAPAEKFHHIFKHTPHKVSNHTENFHGCELHEGEWGTVGSTICWDYFHDGKRRVSKQIVEAIDDEKNSITFKLIEGDLMEHYKKFKIILVVTPKAEGEGSIVHWRFEYEKHHDEIIDPHTLVDLANEMTKDLELSILPNMSSSSDLIGKLETNIEIKAPAEKFHHIFKHTPHNVSNHTENFHGCELHEGEWGTVGSTICWDYFHDGKRRVSKQIVEAIDDEKNSITFKLIEGDLMEHYKSFKIILVVTPKANEGEGSIVHWRFEYEKHHDEIIDPHTLLDLANEVTQDLATHLAHA